MRQHRLTLVSTMFVVLGAASCASTGTVRAANECIAKPNAQARQGEHWYYRIDHATKRQCWYVGPQGASVKKRTTEVSTHRASGARALPAAPQSAHRPTATAPTAAPAATATEANVTAPAVALRWPEAAKWPDVPPLFMPARQPALAEAPRSVDAINPVPAPTSNQAQKPQSPANARSSHTAAPAQAAVEADHTFALITITLALLAIAGFVFHATRSPRRSNAGNRQDLGRPRRSSLNTSYLRARTSLDSDSETGTRHIPPPLKPLDQAEKLAQPLQQLLDEMQTKQYAPPRGLSVATRSSRQPKTQRSRDVAVGNARAT